MILGQCVIKGNSGTTDNAKIRAIDKLTDNGDGTYTTPSGRKIYWSEDASAFGTVIEFDMFGKSMKLLIVLATHRATKYLCNTSVNASEYGLNGVIISGRRYLSLNNACVPHYEDPIITDSQLQTLFPELENTGTAKEICDAMSSYYTAHSSVNSSALEHCRELKSMYELTSDDRYVLVRYTNGLNIPNLYEVCVMFIESEFIDMFDTVTPSSPGLTLGCGLLGNRFTLLEKYFVLSCTPHTNGVAASSVKFNGVVSQGPLKDQEIVVVPVLEL